MQPYVTKCQLQAAFHCRPPELPVGMSCTPPKIVMPSNVETSTDTESYTMSAKSTQDATSEYGEMTDPPPAAEILDQSWPYDILGPKDALRL